MLRWQHSIADQDAYRVLIETYVTHLNLLNNDIPPTDESGDINVDPDSYAFLAYCAKNWGIYYLKAYISSSADIVLSTLRIYNPNSRSYSTWFRIYSMGVYHKDIGYCTSIMISSYFGYEAIAKLLLEKIADIQSKDGFGGAPLLWATKNGHAAVVKLLLEKHANVESEDNTRRIALS